MFVICDFRVDTNPDDHNFFTLMLLGMSGVTLSTLWEPSLLLSGPPFLRRFERELDMGNLQLESLLALRPKYRIFVAHLVESVPQLNDAPTAQVYGEAVHCVLQITLSPIPNSSQIGRKK